MKSIINSEPRAIYSIWYSILQHSAGNRVPYITIFCSTLKLIIRRDSDLLKYIKFSLNGVIDYSSILKFVFYKIFFTIRTTDTYQFLSNKFT